MSRENNENENITLSVYRSRFSHLSRTADVIRSTLQEAIVDGFLEPGTRLREESLAREFGVSRTPVREALHQLRSEKLVDHSPHQGVVVAHLTTEDIFAIYSVREVLEGLAAQLAASRASQEDHHALQEILAEMTRVFELDDPNALARLNLQFHATLRRTANNAYLDHFLSQVEHAVRRFGRTTFSYPGRSEASIEEHRAIAEAVIAGDSERAGELAIEHMRNARQIRVRMLLEQAIPEFS
jgi:DNA-binding GntR family transcriptional regulator